MACIRVQNQILRQKLARNPIWPTWQLHERVQSRALSEALRCCQVQNARFPTLNPQKIPRATVNGLIHKLMDNCVVGAGDEPDGGRDRHDGPATPCAGLLTGRALRAREHRLSFRGTATVATSRNTSQNTSVGNLGVRRSEELKDSDSVTWSPTPRNGCRIGPL